MTPQAAVIVVYYWGCFLGGHTGAHRRVLEQVDYLVRSGARVFVYSYGPAKAQDEDGWTPETIAQFATRFPQAVLVLDAPKRVLRWRTSLKNRLLSLFPGLARVILAASASGRTPNLDAIQRAHPSATFVVNYADGVAQINGVAAERVVVETHDLQFVKWRKLRSKQPADGLTLLRMRQELAVLNAVSGVIAITPRDAHALETLLEEPAVFSVPDYGGDFAVVAPALRPGAFRHDLLFVASDNAFNVAGLRRFLTANRDWLSAYRIAICGRICRNPEIKACGAAVGSVEFLGFVEDLAPVYAGAKACLSPIEGTGLKIKVIEALRHRKPVFASAHSMEGLVDGYESCVFPIERTRIEDLLRHDRVREAAEAAAASYLSRFMGASQVSRLAEFLKLGAEVEGHSVGKTQAMRAN